MSLENFIESLEWRYATKTFDSSKKIPSSVLSKLLEAATLSPSSFGLQPWKFFVVENHDIRQKLKTFAWNQAQITDCSHLIVMSTRNSIDSNYINSYAGLIAKERNVPESAIEEYRNMMLGSIAMMEGEAGQNWMSKQLYLALGILLAACAEAKVDACPMEGFTPSKFDEILNLPSKGYNARVLCALGYRSQTDNYAALKKVRFNQTEVVEILGN